MILLTILLSQAFGATSIGPTAFPVFLKEGFSTILEFEEPPTQVVLGDQSLFQLEKLNRSIIIKPLTAYATTNMFVYFKSKDPRFFILTASEDAEPTYYKNFSAIVPRIAQPQMQRSPKKLVRGAKLNAATFDKKKDFLTVDIEVSADSTARVLPSWDMVRLKFKGRFLSPSKLWSERREIQRDSMVKARFIFTKPNISTDLADATLIIPVKGSTKPITVDLGKVL